MGLVGQDTMRHCKLHNAEAAELQLKGRLSCAAGEAWQQNKMKTD